MIALDGKEGTLSEVALAIKTGRAVIGLGAWTHLEGVEPAADPANAAALAMERARTFREANG